MARLARILSIALITASIVVLIDVGLTVAYKEPVSSIYGAIKQSAAAGEFARVDAQYPRPQDLAAARRAAERQAARNRADSTGSAPTEAERRLRFERLQARVLADRFARQVTQGEAIGRILIPEMGDLDAVVVEGTDSGSLQKGPGHYPGTSFPGQPGTVAIAGHRTTYLAPFRDVAEVEAGDRIVVAMPYGNFTYRITRTEIVTPDRIDVVDDVGYPQLVLSACHPMYSAAERYIVFARLSRIDLSA